jgi:cobalt-zinc-cadmium efflux system membrane fusion protein
MCASHGVLEAVCTKCNPALVPIFQAKGDWCAEHGFPESFCPICRPEAGGRPARDVTGEAPTPEDAVDGTRVRFKSEQSAALAGLVIEPASVASQVGGITVPGTIVADPSRTSKVNARAPGVLQQVMAEVGAVVRKGDPLATITSSEAGASRAGVQAAEARVRAARAEHDREKALRDAKIASEQDLVAARRDLAEAEADLAAARAEVGILGSVGPGGTYTLRAPLDGVVTERSASVGELVHPEEAIFTLIDPRHVWLELDVPERHLASIAVGSEVQVEHAGAALLRARIETLSPVIDPGTRTARARAMLPNAAGDLRINARVRAHLGAVGGGPAASVGAEAVQRIGTHDVVFVRRASDEFELKRVDVASRGDGRVTLLHGVAPGDDVVTTGSFLLKTEVLKASIGSGCCEVE